MKSINQFVITISIAVVGLFSQPAISATAGFSVPADEYSIFNRKDGIAEIRLKTIRSTYTSGILDCVDNNIVSIGNVNDAGFNDTLMATLLTAWSTKAKIQLNLSDDPLDKDLNNNCGVILLHLQCEGCPSGL